MTARVARIAAAFSCLVVAGGFVPAGVTYATAAPVSRQTYSISEFDTVRLDAPMEVVITTGKGVSAIGTGDRDTL
ncbi:MAG: hypothetical protein ABW164_04245, partial [Sphingobium sp.]